MGGAHTQLPAYVGPAQPKCTVLFCPLDLQKKTLATNGNRALVCASFGLGYCVEVKQNPPTKCCGTVYCLLLWILLVVVCSSMIFLKLVD